MNNRGAHTAKSGEFGIMAVLMLANRVPEMVTHQRAGHWHKLWGAVVTQRTITIVGLGSLGGAVARHAAAFRMAVTGVRANPAPHPFCAQVVGPDRLDEILPATTFLVLACPLTDATRGLIDRRRLELLPKDSGIVNIGRGRVDRSGRAMRPARLRPTLRRRSGRLRSRTNSSWASSLEHAKPGDQPTYRRRRSIDVQSHQPGSVPR